MQIDTAHRSKTEQVLLFTAYFKPYYLVKLIGNQFISVFTNVLHFVALGFYIFVCIFNFLKELLFNCSLEDIYDLSNSTVVENGYNFTSFEFKVTLHRGTLTSVVYFVATNTNAPI